MRPETPDLKWYMARSRAAGLSPRCPFASVHRCPRYYESRSLMGRIGSLPIDSQEDELLEKKWKNSELWPLTDEEAATVTRSGERFSSLLKFCPEVTYNRFGIFVTFASRYTDEIDVEIAHRSLKEKGADRTHWRWSWDYITPLHYTECPLYSLLSHQVEKRTQTIEIMTSPNNSDSVLDLKPSIWGTILRTV